MPIDQVTLKGGQSPVVTPRATLVFYHRAGSTVAHLDRGKTLTVGRSAPADIEIPDPGLSRQHARFTFDEHGLAVEDLGSTNGTTRNGEAVTRAAILSGDDIALGPVHVSVHMMTARDEELRGIDGHDRFRQLLADEITRARTFARPLALVLVQSVDHPVAHVSTWASRLRAQLRPVDRVGLFGPGGLLVALPELPTDAARGFAAALAGGTPALACRVAMFPSDGNSVDELIAALQVAKRGAVTPAPRSADVSGMVVRSAAMKQVMAQVHRLASSTISVLINGETGTGKEVIAHAIHDGGPRAKRPMRSINCAAIPANLIESMLFGHEQGAFTGADKQAKGIFEQADGGTVLLDEIGELEQAAQAALLRVLETKKLMRVGGDKEIAVDVRVLAATHRDLDAMVAAGKFRQDLLYRLNTMVVHIPPLRERADEIGPIAERFLDAAREQSGNDVRSIDPAALAALVRYEWPGNVRELRNVIDRAVVLAEGRSITVAELPERIAREGGEPEPVERPSGNDDAFGAPPLGEGDYRDHVKRYEAELIVRALHKTSGNQTEAAKLLGLPLRTLVHKIKQYGIKKSFDK